MSLFFFSGIPGSAGSLGAGLCPQESSCEPPLGCVWGAGPRLQHPLPSLLWGENKAPLAAAPRPGFSEGIPNPAVGSLETTGDSCEASGALVSLAGFQTRHLGSQGAWHDLVQGLFISCSVKVPFIDLNQQLGSNSRLSLGSLKSKEASVILYYFTLQI